MRAELKSLTSPDADLEAYQPHEIRDLHLLIEAFIGPAGSDESEQFQLVVVSPEYLRARVESTGPLFFRYYLVVDRFDIRAIESAIARYCKECRGETWTEVAGKIARFMQWEIGEYGPWDSLE